MDMTVIFIQSENTEKPDACEKVPDPARRVTDPQRAAHGVRHVVHTHQFAHAGRIKTRQFREIDDEPSLAPLKEQVDLIPQCGIDGRAQPPPQAQNGGISERMVNDCEWTVGLPIAAQSPGC
jgi:hypothetical protein